MKIFGFVDQADLESAMSNQEEDVEEDYINQRSIWRKLAMRFPMPKILSRIYKSHNS